MRPAGFELEIWHLCLFFVFPGCFVRIKPSAFLFPVYTPSCLTGKSLLLCPSLEHRFSSFFLPYRLQVFLLSLAQRQCTVLSITVDSDSSSFAIRLTLTFSRTCISITLPIRSLMRCRRSALIPDPSCICLPHYHITPRPCTLCVMSLVRRWSCPSLYMSTGSIQYTSCVVRLYAIRGNFALGKSWRLHIQYTAHRPQPTAHGPDLTAYRCRRSVSGALHACPRGNVEIKSRS